MKLFISGRGKFVNNRLTPTALRVKEILDKSKDGELFTVNQLATLTEVGVSTIQDGEMKRLLPGYSHLVKTRRYWGKPATIKQLIKETR